LPSQLWPADDLVNFICGDEILKMEHFEKTIKFSDNVDGHVKAHLAQYISKATEPDLRAFLRFVTSTENFSHRYQTQTGAEKGAGGSEEDNEDNEEQEEKEEQEHGKGDSIYIDQVGCDRMPTARTCFRELDLPNETKYDVFKQKLNEAIRHGLSSGFQAE